MSVEQLEQSVLNLTAEERRRFLDWLCDHEEEWLGRDAGLHPEARAEILRRRDEALAHPEKLEDWDAAFARMQQRFDELRRQNPFSR
jgi:recombinational DNA repair ATPase RecF